MCLKFSALLGCQLWEKGLSVTNPVFFVPVCGGENLAWHQMPLNRCFSKQRQKKKNGLPRPLLLLLLLLVSCLTNTLNLSRLSYICQEHGLYLTLLPWFQLLYGAGHVFTVYIMGCWEKRGRTGVLVPFGATFKCVRLCVFLMLQAVVSSSQANAESKRPHEGMVITTPTLIGWDVPWTPRDHGHMVKLHECISVCCVSRLLIIEQLGQNHP